MLSKNKWDDMKLKQTNKQTKKLHSEGNYQHNTKAAY